MSTIELQRNDCLSQRGQGLTLRFAGRFSNARGLEMEVKNNEISVNIAVIEREGEQSTSSLVSRVIERDENQIR